MRGSRREGDRGSELPEKIGFLSKTGPDPVKNHKATKPVSNVWASSVRQRKGHLNGVLLTGQ